MDAIKTDLGIGKAQILSMQSAPDGYGINLGRNGSHALLKICSAHPRPLGIVRVIFAPVLKLNVYFTHNYRILWDFQDGIHLN